MKKAFILLSLFFTLNNASSQNYLSPDTSRRHEISVSVLPMINFLSGSFEGSTYTNFNFGYKYYLKNSYVLRTAVVLFPQGFHRPYRDGFLMYDYSVGNKNIFYFDQAYGSMKSQFNLGVEKNYKFNRLIHAFGVDAFINHAQVTYQRKYFYRYNYQNLVWSMVSDTVDYSVDSLGYKQTENRIGVGLQLFYSVKYKISKRFYLSATIGPSFNMYRVRVNRYDNRTKENTIYRATGFEFPNVGLISDISICLRL